MQIRQHLSLYLFNQIFDARVNDQGHSHLLRNNLISLSLLMGAEYLLKDFHHWFGHAIIVFSNTAQLEKGTYQIGPTVSKIKSFIFAFLFFPLGIFLKTLYSIYNFSYVYKRNQFILEQIQLQKTLEKQTIKCSQNQFKEINSQSQSLLCTLPQELFFKVLTFSKNKDICFVNQTCKQNYNIIFSFIKNQHKIETHYAPALVKALDKKFGHIPFAGNWNQAIRDLNRMNKQIKFHQSVAHDPNFPIQSDISELIEIASDLEKRAHEGLKKCKLSMIKIKAPDGYGLLIDIKDHFLNKTQLLIFTKNELIFGHWKLSKNLLSFLNKMYSSDTIDCVEYIRRLFNGEPCGNFPDPVEETEQNNNRPSNLLEEGPVVCEDRQTPVIQLCQYS